ncbi:hypothetical protein Sjap_013368 [Stephania japonica]|uniref:Uncharacterized protein n=1 Tax=Stephania japonica TaxID=461633 RepID=A0AAP0J092_9MAGN
MIIHFAMKEFYNSDLATMMHVIQRDIKTIGPRTSHHGEIATKVTRLSRLVCFKAFNWHANMPTQSHCRMHS